MGFFSRKKNRNKLLEDFLKNDYSVFYKKNYTVLSETPEVIQCINKIADLISSMSIKLYENTPIGDIRIRNELSRKIDVEPNEKMTRKTFIFCLVRDLILYGNAYAIPITKGGYLKDIKIVNYQDVNQDGYIYEINGVHYEYDEILHFILHPKDKDFTKGDGLKLYLKDVIKTLGQANTTKNNFLSNQFQPSVIIKVDSMEEILTSDEGQKALKEKYLNSVESGTPFFIPTNLLDVQTIKPLTLNDIAIIDNIKIDKATIGNFLGVPLFMLGLEKFNIEEYNQFINGIILTISQCLEQEFTKKLLISKSMYFKFNKWSLYQYDLIKLGMLGKELSSVGLVRGNEVRNWLDLPPDEKLEDFIVLENYIPLDKVGDQKKLKGGVIDEEKE